jgi:hypothetical protein
MTRLLKAYCKKYDNHFKIDIGEKSYDEVIAIYKRQTSFHCNAGNHVELSSPLNYWTIEKEVVEKVIPTNEEKLMELKKNYSEVYQNKDLSEFYEVSGFSAGCCICRNKATKKKAYFDFTHIGNERYYYKIGDE